jgi:hypothetical protein
MYIVDEEIVMEEALSKYLEAVKADFVKFYASNFAAGGDRKEYADQRIAEFNAGVKVEYGSKFIRIVTERRSAHSFIVLRDQGKFKAGDILKSASWASPAKNFARGNIFAGTFSRVGWTGVC